MNDKVFGGCLLAQGFRGESVAGSADIDALNK